MIKKKNAFTLIELLSSNSNTSSNTSNSNTKDIRCNR